MAQVVITAIGSAGDVHPFVGIGRALAARGHRIVFCTHPPFAALAEQQGFAFVPIGTAHEYAAALANPALWNPRTSFRMLWSFIAPTIRPHFNKLASILTSETVLVGSLWAFAARIMQEVHRTPYVSVQVSPSTLLSAVAPPTHKRLIVPPWLPLFARTALMRLLEEKVLDKALAPALDETRASFGLPPARHILGTWLHSTDGVLCLFPEWFAAPQPDWPNNHFLCGFPLFSDVIGEQPRDEDLEEFLATGPAPVVFTPGSTVIDERAYFRAVDDALRFTGARAIVLARRAPSSLSATAHLRVRSFVPLQKLLPHCAAIVHHGGIGTASLAFSSGIPQVVTPFAHDQFDNAARVVKTGCGLRIDGPASGRALAGALMRVAADGSFADRCAQVKQLIEATPSGCGAAAQYIERFAPRPRIDATRRVPA